MLTTQCTLQCRKVTKVYQSFKMQIYLISANKMCKLYDLFRVLHIICRKLRMLAMCSELCKHYPAVQCTDNAVRSALHIALRRMQLCTVVHCTEENAWCARDRKWRRGVRAVASWTPSRAHRPHISRTFCATFAAHSVCSATRTTQNCAQFSHCATFLRAVAYLPQSWAHRCDSNQAFDETLVDTDTSTVPSESVLKV